MKFFILCFVLWFRLCSAENLTFPKNFIFGVSTSAYQIEGAWNIGGKGENIWDRFTHIHPGRIKDRSTGDISCDSYHHFKEDVQLLNFLGVDFYRFSLSWSRILPTGYTNRINEEGINFYNNLIDELLKNDIQPMITLYHWDLPQPLQDVGGWPNPALSDYFEDYAKLVFEKFGDRVKIWVTFNEPKLICVYGYGGTLMAPGLNASGIGEYLCGYTILKAHARVYHLYDEMFRKKQEGRIGIALHTEWFEPGSDKEEDLQASETKLQFDFGWFGNPIFHKSGDYPSIMKERVSIRSKMEGFERSRLPALSAEEVNFIQGTFDFLGLNVYTASMVSHSNEEADISQPSYHKDVGVKVWKDPKWPSTPAKRLKVVPWAFRKLLNWIKHRYGNIEMIITENGYADDGRIRDENRVKFFQKYLYSLLQAIEYDGVNVQGFSAWTLLDNFEWFGGYTERYGLFSVNFNKANRPRKPKLSAYFYKELIETRNIYLQGKFDNKSNNLSSSNILVCLSVVTGLSHMFISKK